MRKIQTQEEQFEVVPDQQTAPSQKTHRIVFTRRNTMATTLSPQIPEGGNVFYLKAVAGDNRSRQHVGYATVYPDRITVATVSGKPVGTARSRAEARQMIDAYHRKHNARDYSMWMNSTLT